MWSVLLRPGRKPHCVSFRFDSIISRRLFSRHLATKMLIIWKYPKKHRGPHKNPLHAARGRVFETLTQDCILIKKGYFTGYRVIRQETKLTRTIRRNQRYKQKHLKNNMSIWPARLSVQGASKLMSWFPPTFSVKKRRFSRGVSANTARFLRFASLQTLRILAPEGIANFGITLAKHCNIIFCSFVLQIDWWKPFLRGHA